MPELDTQEVQEVQPQEAPEAPAKEHPAPGPIMMDTTMWPRCPYCNKPVDTEAHPIRYATQLIDMGGVSYAPGSDQPIHQPYAVYQVIYCGNKKCHKVLAMAFVGTQPKTEEMKQREVEGAAPPVPQAPILHTGARAIAELNGLGRPRPLTRFARHFGSGPKK